MVAPRAASPARRNASVSACGRPPGCVQPRPTITGPAPSSRTITAPTAGLGQVRPSPRRPSAKANAIKRSSAAGSLILPRCGLWAHSLNYSRRRRRYSPQYGRHHETARARDPCCCLPSAAPTSPASAQASFAGKTIRLSVNFAAGGPADLLARQVAPFIAKHAPGKPTIIVENCTGAGGMVGANTMFNSAKPDGLTMGWLVGVTTQGLIGGDNIRFDPAKFRWLGALSQTPGTACAQGPETLRATRSIHAGDAAGLCQHGCRAPRRRCRISCSST